MGHYNREREADICGSATVSFYQDKADYHHKQWQAATDANKEKASAFHMQEYLNYSEMLKGVN